MQTVNLRSQHHLYRKKIIVFFTIFLFAISAGVAQKMSWIKKPNRNYDNKKITYGFLIGLHSSSYQIKYSPEFVTPEFDTVYSVEPSWSPGFSLGFIINHKLDELWDIRLTPTVGFYEHRLRYNFTDDTKTEEQLVETTMVEFPILIKFKSEKRNNIRMYMIGGLKPAFEASGKRKLENVTTTLEVKGGNVSVDLGFGLDIYYPLFKFSPELRFSKGIVDVLDNKTNKYGAPLQRVNTNLITLNLIFQ